jgi:hypothetical protein
MDNPLLGISGDVREIKTYNLVLFLLFFHFFLFFHLFLQSLLLLTSAVFGEYRLPVGWTEQ